jgi:negative regulator of genetic competence, sporulation and motility
MRKEFSIVYNRTITRQSRLEKAEKLDEFFTAMMEDKNGKPHNPDWGEIIVEISSR